VRHYGRKTKNKFKPIAVVGVAAIFPGSVNVTGYWKNIMEGADLIEEIPPDYWFIEDYYDPNPFAPDKPIVKDTTMSLKNLVSILGWMNLICLQEQILKEGFFLDLKIMRCCFFHYIKFYR